MKSTSILILVMVTTAAFVGCREKPRTLSRVEVRAMDGLPVWEYKLLNKKTKDIPKSGFEIASHNATLIVEKYDMPYGITANDYTPISLTKEDAYLYAQPHVFSFIVKSARSLQLVDAQSCWTFAVKLSTTLLNEKPLAVMCIFPVASSSDGHTHIFRSDYWLPVSASCDYANDGQMQIKDRWGLVGDSDENADIEVQLVPMQNSDDRVCIVESNDDFEIRMNAVSY